MRKLWDFLLDAGNLTRIPKSKFYFRFDTGSGKTQNQIDVSK